MTDYEKATGSGGRMVIRDDGDDTVQFLIQAGFSTTFKADMPFSWTVNGSSGSDTKDYPTGAPLLLLKTFTVTTSQTVTFTLGSTGTSGLGGPTTFSKAISRSTVPGKPTLDAPVMTHTTAVIRWADGTTGGSAITSRQYQISTSSSFTGATWVTGGVLTSGKYQVTISNLIPGTTYYFRVRSVNAVGNGTASDSKTAATYAGARVRVGGVWKNAVPYVRVAGVWKVAVPYVKVGGTWKATTI